MPITTSDYLIRTIMTSNTGLVADQVVNDFAVKWMAGGAPTSAELADAMDAVGDFFRSGAAAIDRVGSYISNAVDRAATHEIQAVSILTGGSPVLTQAWLGPVASFNQGGLPTEVAGVLSFHGVLTGIAEEVAATRPRARRRGRIYVGPLDKSALDGNANPRLNTDFTLAMRANATAMYDRLEGDGWRWSVWSRADAVLFPIIAGWTDNAPDVQRRRGIESSVRTVYTTA